MTTNTEQRIVPDRTKSFGAQEPKGMSAEEVAAHLGVDKLMAYGFLKTLESNGLVKVVGKRVGPNGGKPVLLYCFSGNFASTAALWGKLADNQGVAPTPTKRRAQKVRAQSTETQPAQKRRGRPPGSKNKPKDTVKPKEFVRAAIHQIMENLKAGMEVLSKAS